MTDNAKENASAIYLVGHGSFQEPRLIELQYRRIIRYMEALDGKSGGSPDIFMDLNIRRSDELRNLSELRQRMNDYTRIFIDIQDSRFDSVLQVVCDALADGPKILNASDDGGVLDRKVTETYGENAHAGDITDGSDFTCFFPTLASNVLEAALRQETTPSILKCIESLRALQPYRGGKKPVIDDGLILEWKRRRR